MSTKAQTKPEPQDISPFSPVLQKAFDGGSEILVQMKHSCGDQYKGQILDIQAETFNLYHSGPEGGVLWTFCKADIAFCGLIIDPPFEQKLPSSHTSAFSE